MGLKREPGTPLEEARSSRILWCKYYANGRAIRESTGTDKELEARRFLKAREGAVATGQPLLPRVDRIRYEEIAAGLKRHYEATGTRDLAEYAYRVKHLDSFFAQHRVATIGQTDVDRYIVHARARAPSGRRSAESSGPSRRCCASPGQTKNDEGRVVYLTPELAGLLTTQLERIRAVERRTGRIIPTCSRASAGGPGWASAGGTTGRPGTRPAGRPASPAGCGTTSAGRRSVTWSTPASRSRWS
jgi:hypothetical protein